MDNPDYVEYRHGNARLSSLLLVCLLTFLMAGNNVFADKSTVTTKTLTPPPLILNDLQGKRRNLTEWHYKVIILNFWATWCGPCQIEIPHLIEYQSIYGNNGLQVIGVGLDEERKLKNFVRTLGINYPVLQVDSDQHSHLLHTWGNSLGILPFTVIIDPSGQLVFKQFGILSDEAFNTYVKPLINDKPIFYRLEDNKP